MPTFSVHMNFSCKSGQEDNNFTCDMRFQVTGEGSNRQREKIQRQRDAVPVTEVGSQCKLTFKMPGKM